MSLVDGKFFCDEGVKLKHWSRLERIYDMFLPCNMVIPVKKG